METFFGYTDRGWSDMAYLYLVDTGMKPKTIADVVEHWVCNYSMREPFDAFNVSAKLANKPLQDETGIHELLRNAKLAYLGAE